MSGNPFIEKAERRKSRPALMAQRNHAELVKLFERFTDDDNPETRERIRLRVEEAKEAADRYK